MSCLFRSLSYFIKDMDETKLRAMIVQHMKTDPVLFDDSLKLSEILKISQLGELSHYCQQMSLPSTWGGAIEIRVFCDLFHASVHVHVLSSGKIIEFIPFTAPQQCTLLKNLHITWNGSHYEPLHS